MCTVVNINVKVSVNVDALKKMIAFHYGTSCNSSLVTFLYEVYQKIIIRFYINGGVACRM